MKSITQLCVLTVVATLTLALGAATADAAKPEDVFKGKIMVLKKRLPLRFSSEGQFVSAVKSSKTDMLWPTMQKGNDIAEWELEYVAFFAQPLTDFEVTASFYDITSGGRRLVATDAQMQRDRNTRVFFSNIKLAKPEFDVNHRYMMTLTSRGRVIASTNFWLRGKGPNYGGKVEFSDDDARKR